MLMQPDKTFITIEDNERLIQEFIQDMMIRPRKIAHKWSMITNQTPNLKIGYPAQHLASLIVGMKGMATGARGNDIIDGSEVKACSKVDQLDKCRSCGRGILRSNLVCPYCGSAKIKRNNDSKWLIGIRSENELKMAIEETPRFIFLITDYPNFADNDFAHIRIRAFEVWVRSERSKRFRELLYNYYHYIYLKHIEQDPNQTPAPKNLFPDNFPFYMCNPIKVFECLIEKALSDEPNIKITSYVKPDVNRENLESELMPITLLNKREREILKARGIDISNLQNIDEKTRNYLDLRDTDKTIKSIGRKKHKGL